MLKKYAWLTQAALQLKGAKINYKIEWEAYQLLIGDKMFAYIGTNNNDQEILTLKGEPDHNQAIIEIYDCVTEGYYMNKIHWISIKLEDPNPVPQNEVIRLLEKSYQLIFDKLPKKIKQQINP